MEQKGDKSLQKNRILQNYDQKARDNNTNVQKRQMRSLIEINEFNNWIKSVLMNVYSMQMCKKVQKQLDLKKGNQYNQILHVLDIGCGRGQDILKWRNCRVKYMVASDFSGQCLKQYQRRWKQRNQPYKLYTVAEDFTKQNLYYEIQHSYYDMVSAQFCFHYMFGNEAGLKNGLTTIFSNLLIDGVFIATIPDSYTILKKINQKGIKQKDGSVVYGNQYFSIRFKNTHFNKPFGNIYEFYLQEAVGNKNPQTGQIQYVEEWLICLDQLQKLLKNYGVVIDMTMNFLEFYLKYRDQYRDLLGKFKNLNYQSGRQMDSAIWQIGHLYRVLVCRKVSQGKHISEFNLAERRKASMKQIPRLEKDNKQSRDSYRDNRDNRDNRDRSRNQQHRDYGHQNRSYPKYDHHHQRNDYHKKDRNY